MIENLKKNQALITFLLFPILYMGFGFQKASQYGKSHWFIALLFYFFILVNQFLYEMLRKNTLLKLAFSYSILAAAEILNLAIIFVLYYQMKSVQLLLVLLFYTVARQLIVFFYFYPPIVGWLAVLSETLLNIFLLNGVSQYLQNKFLLLKFNVTFIPLAIAYTWLLTSYWQLQIDRKEKLLFAGSLITSFIIIFSRHIGYWILLLLLLFPFLWRIFQKEKALIDLKMIALLSGFLSLLFNYKV